jgi:hypothetical protein
MLRKAHRLAVLKYTEQIVALAHMSPNYIRRLFVACVQRRKFLERKLDMMQKSWREDMFEQFQETLVQFELMYEQIWPLKVGVEACADELEASGGADEAQMGTISSVPVSASAIQGELKLNLGKLREDK